MPKYRVTWCEYYTETVETDNEEEIFDLAQELGGECYESDNWQYELLSDSPSNES